MPKQHLLQNGWLGFIFNSPEDTALILGRFWPFDGGSLMLKRWRLGFNPTSEFFSHRHIWVLLPGLPLQLWNQRAFEHIGASLGRFLRVDSTSLEASDRRMAKIYVEIDIQAGLPEVLEIDWRNQLFSQRLDYLGIPFRCSFCRRTGHLRRDCSKFPPPDVDLDPAEETFFNGYISSPEQPAKEIPGQGGADTYSSDTLVGKIQNFCPSLYCTLSARDRLYIIEQADFILPPVPPISLPAQSASSTLPSTRLPISPEPIAPVNTSSTLPPPFSNRDSETVPISATDLSQDSITLAGYTEPSHSTSQLENLLQEDNPTTTLPFDSIPLQSYNGKTIVHPSSLPADQPSSSFVHPSPVLDPTWSKGIGLELSPLKTRSARKKTLTGLSSTTPDSTTSVPTHGALRDLKALARGKS
jgi:hypothetical protein